MAKLTLVKSNVRANTNVAAHRASATEGEAAKRLLEDQGFPLKRKANGQYEFACPFHEGPGAIPKGKGTNFYMHAESSVYVCQSASCGERGNLVTLERHFGIALEFQNCCKVAAFRPDAVGTPAHQEFVSPRSQLLNQAPALVSC